MADEAPDAPEEPQRGYGDEAWFDELEFVFAKTMPEIPHEYVIRRPASAKGAGNWDAFMTLWRTIAERGVPGSFNGRRYKYWYRGDGWRYWCMGPKWPYLINRAKVEGIEGNGHELLDPDGSGGGPR